MAKCNYCNDTGIYRKPKNEEEFNNYIDRELNKGYFVNLLMATKLAYKKLGYTEIKCPYCSKNDSVTE